jgi:hypothetical protein
MGLLRHKRDGFETSCSTHKCSSGDTTLIIIPEESSILKNHNPLLDYIIIEYLVIAFLVWEFEMVNLYVLNGLFYSLIIMTFPLAAIYLFFSLIEEYSKKKFENIDILKPLLLAILITIAFVIKLFMI